MRLIFPVLALTITVSSIAVDFARLPASSPICLHGFCRFDQLFSRIDSEGADLKNMGALLNEDPSNPSTWCSYGELLWKSGDTDGARAAFSRAILLGPGMSPVLMRAANFDFSQGHEEEALALAKRILSQTDGFDEILFSYLQRSRVPNALDAGLPPEPRAAKAWLAWIGRNGTDREIADTWTWMKEQHVCDEGLAVESVRLLWDRRAFEAAQAIWADWVGPADDYLKPDRLFNRRFQRLPAASPFDWKLEAVPSVEISQRGGLDIRFLGQENVSFSHVHQFATVSAGRYRFAAEIEAHDLTSDQRPFFHVFDAEPLRKVDVQTKAVPGNAARSWMTLDFDVPSGTRAVGIEIERRASVSGDRPITGTLHVYEVSLARR